MVHREMPRVVADMNRRFIAAEIERCNDLFNDIDGKSLDEQQREAVVTDELNNLVIAGAGSGKTLTISAKVNYLCEKRDIHQMKYFLLHSPRKRLCEPA
jgi:DNA helicase-4